MSTALHHPPGRAGRLWLQRRLAVALRAAGLLEVQVRLLRREEERARTLAGRTAAAWEARCREAEDWLLRAAVSTGERGLRPEPAEPAAVAVGWASVMGVRFPASASCTPGAAPPGTWLAAGAAVPEAAAAYRAALVAGVQHAAADGALRAVTAELGRASARLRAVQDRWVPRLEGALRAVDLALDERERADTARLRWASSRAPGGGRR